MNSDTHTTPSHNGATPELIAAFIALIVLVAGSAVLSTADSPNTPIKNTAATASSTTSLDENPFENIDIEARAAYVWDTKRRQAIFARNPHSQLPLASISKLMTALVAYESLSDTQVVRIDRHDLAADGDNGLLRNERWSLKNIIDFTLVESSNDGARALASAIEAHNTSTSTIHTTDLMNKKAREIGLENTFFLNPSGLDIEENSVGGGYGSARDVTLLVDTILRTNPELLERTSEKNARFTSLDGITHNATNTNEIVESIPFLIASKTGFTDLAGGNLTIAFNAGLSNPYIITVLGSSREGRFSDIKQLYDATQKYIYQQSRKESNLRQ